MVTLSLSNLAWVIDFDKLSLTFRLLRISIAQQFNIFLNFCFLQTYPDAKGKYFSLWMVLSTPS